MVLRGANNADEDVQLWATIRDQLRLIDELQGQIVPVQEEYERARAAVLAEQDGSSKVNKVKSEPARPLDEVSLELNGLLTRARDLSDNTIEKLGILQALLTSAGDEFDSGRKRRRIEASSPGPTLLSNAPSRKESPTVSPPSADKGGKAVDALGKKGKGWRRGVAQQSAAPSLKPVTNAGTATLPNNTANTLSAHGGWTDPARARREQLGPQLPLRPGRKVAFRLPLSKGETQAPDDGETWIMATIVECINNDRNRYVVKDADPDTETRWNTTLKSIVPLPESSATLPPKNYPPGHEVLAVYPDTSCFYRAIVRGGGPGPKGSDRHRKSSPDLLHLMYLLAFEDDDDDIKSVTADLVVERPRV